MRIPLIVNGQRCEAEVADPNMSLLTYLREGLHLMGSKNGCAAGHCGACTVIVDGEAQRSCLLRMARMTDRSVQTIEGISTASTLHPLQFAFLQQGAVQCGFCTPGMIMAAKALLDHNLDPSDDEIKQALASNLCRCTGYVQIVAAVREAARLLREGVVAVPRDRALPLECEVLGTSVPRIDGVARVTGELAFADDLWQEGMLTARILRSAWPHARLLGIDTAEAEAMPGVVAVMTAKDVPGEKHFGLIQSDWPVLALDRVRFVGDAVAVVYAETGEAAEAALARIKVSYEPLPVVNTPQEALAPSAPLIHESGNELAHIQVSKGDVETGLAEADVVVEGDYYTPFVEHAYLEPQAALAVPQPDGGVTIHVGSQGPSDDQRQIAACLGLPIERVRIAHMPMGGGFGGKEDITVQILAALGALKLQRPVKLTHTRAESISASVKRHAEYLHYKTGAKRDGRITAVQATIYGDTGAYASVGEAVLLRSASFACGPYVVPNVRVDSYAVYTNNVPAGAMRGFGNPQATFASEVQMDRLAEALGMDPGELRRINMLDTDTTTATGHRLTASVGAKPTLEAVRQALARRPLPTPRPGWRRGVGIAASYKNVSLGTGQKDGSGARLELADDGYLDVHVGCTDMGQGSNTVMAQLAAQTVGWPYGRIRVYSGDTHRDPPAGMTTASRSTFVSGNAVVRAGARFRDELLPQAALELGVAPEDLLVRGEELCDRRSGRTLATLSELAKRLRAKGRRISVEEYYLAPETYRALQVPTRGYAPGEDRLHNAYSFGAQAAVVEVNEATGEVNVLRIVAAHDVGRPVNPLGIEGQITGGVMMGIGYALYEEFVLRDGRIITDTLRRLRIPTVWQVPEIEPIIVEDPHPEGPYGAKGMGELPASLAAPAVVNAIHDAVGVWIQTLPVRPEKVLAALRERELQAKR